MKLAQKLLLIAAPPRLVRVFSKLRNCVTLSTVLAVILKSKFHSHILATMYLHTYRIRSIKPKFFIYKSVIGRLPLGIFSAWSSLLSSRTSARSLPAILAKDLSVKEQCFPEMHNQIFESEKTVYVNKQIRNC